MENFVLAVADFDNDVTMRIPHAAKMLCDAYIVIFGEQKFSVTSIPGQKNFVLDTSEIHTINNVLTASTRMLTNAGIDLDFVGTNNADTLLLYAVQKFSNNKKQTSRRNKKTMEEKHIRRAFCKQFGTMPEPVYAAWVFYLMSHLADALSDGRTMDALAIMACMTKLSFLTSVNRRTILAANTKNFNAKYTKLVSAYNTGRINPNADKETLLRDVQEITDIPYTNTKMAQRLLEKLKAESIYCANSVKTTN